MKLSVTIPSEHEEEVVRCLSKAAGAEEPSTEAARSALVAFVRSTVANVQHSELLSQQPERPEEIEAIK